MFKIVFEAKLDDRNKHTASKGLLGGFKQVPLMLNRTTTLFEPASLLLIPSKLNITLAMVSCSRTFASVIISSPVLSFTSLHNFSNQLYAEKLEVPGDLYQDYFMPNLHQAVLSQALNRICTPQCLFGLSSDTDYDIKKNCKSRTLIVANMKLRIVSYKRRKYVYVGSLESSQLGQSN